MSVAESRELVTLLEGILDECEDDHVGLWSILRDVRNTLGHASSTEIKGMTLDLLTFLLRRHLIEAGFPAANGRDFEPWKLSPPEAIKKISDEWDKLGREPSGGEVVWFTMPKKAA
jgi:hypothetical protein